MFYLLRFRLYLLLLLLVRRRGIFYFLLLGILLRFDSSLFHVERLLILKWLLLELFLLSIAAITFTSFDKVKVVLLANLSNLLLLSFKIPFLNTIKKAVKLFQALFKFILLILKPRPC